MTIQTLLSELSNWGVTDLEIGKRVGLSQATVTRLRNGKHLSTSFESGTAIQALHAEKAAEQQPVEKVA